MTILVPRAFQTLSDLLHIARLAIVVAISTVIMVDVSHAKSACGESHSTTISLPDPVSGRHYEIYVSLPADYLNSSSGTYPLVVLADGGRAFPKLSCAARAAAKGDLKKQAIIVGLSYAAGEDLEDSRRRDYTPTKLENASKAYGGAAAYQTYVVTVVLPFIEKNYRLTKGHRIFWGHSYGGLFGAHILLTAPTTFQTYILGSPSFWFDDDAIFDLEARYAAFHRTLAANVILYVGGLETSRYDAARKGKTRDMVRGMSAFEERLRARNYRGLRMTSKVIAKTDHRSSVGPGFLWGLTTALEAGEAL